MKKLLIVLVAFAACLLMNACTEQNKVDKIKKEPKTVSSESAENYKSIEEYHDEIGKRTVITKPVFSIKNKKLHVDFDVLYPDELEQKFKHTKESSYYAVTEVEGQNKLDQLIDISKLPTYKNNLDAIPKGKNGYKYSVSIPLKKQPSEVEEKELTNGENYILMYLNEKTEVVNILQVMDVGLNNDPQK